MLAAVLLCAGKGTRMNDNSINKVCFPCAGVPVIKRIVDNLRAGGIGTFVVVVGHQAQSVMEALGDEPGVIYAYQKEQKGTGHATLCGLMALKNAGKKLILATSKPVGFATEILEHFGLLAYFDFIGGATFDHSRSKKGDVIAYVLKKWGITDLSKAVMIGDRKHDVIGAKENGLDSIGVLYGYGNLEEMQEADATYIAQTVADILPLI